MVPQQLQALLEGPHWSLRALWRSGDDLLTGLQWQNDEDSVCNESHGVLRAFSHPSERSISCEMASSVTSSFLTQRPSAELWPLTTFSAIFTRQWTKLQLLLARRSMGQLGFDLFLGDSVNKIRFLFFRTIHALDSWCIHVYIYTYPTQSCL